MNNMQAEELMDERYVMAEEMVAELVIWRLPKPMPGSAHSLKYRLVLVVSGECVLRYDNERGKGDHKHVHGRDVPYAFVSLDQLLVDFWSDVDKLGG